MARQFPAKIIAGDSLKLDINSGDYLVSDGFGINVNFTGPSGSPTQYTYATTQKTGNDNVFELAVLPAVTATYANGLYSYAIIATDGTDEFTIESGTFEAELRADLNSNSDFRSHNRKVLDAINAVIENRASKDQESYTIAGRTLNRTSVGDLLKLKNHYEGLVKKEEGAEKYKLKIRMGSR